MKDYEVDTVGAHAPPDRRDPRVIAVQDLVDRYGETFVKMVILSIEQEALGPEPAPKERVYWPEFVCRAVGRK